MKLPETIKVKLTKADKDNQTNYTDNHRLHFMAGFEAHVSQEQENG